MKTIKELTELGKHAVSGLLNANPDRPTWFYEYSINQDYLPHNLDEKVDTSLNLMYCFKHTIKYEENKQIKYKIDYTNVDILFVYEPERDNYKWHLVDHKNN